MRSDGDSVGTALGLIEEGYAMLVAESFDAQTHSELLAVQSRLETVSWKQPAIMHKLIGRLAAEASPVELGGKNLADVLATRLRISAGEARRRIKSTESLGPRSAMTGEPLAPKLPHVAKAQADGRLGPEHLRIVEKFFDQLPDSVDYQTRELAEADLARIGGELGPTQFHKAADRLMALVHPDGDFSDVDRARRRHLIIGRQGPDGLSKINGLLDPESRATLDAVFSKWAAPGMCNPADDAPCVDGSPSEAHIQNDQRSAAQRNHDALKAMGRSVLASGELGKHNGLPCTIVVSTTLQELESGAGHAVTGGGTLLPMRDVIRLASHAHHYVVIYDKHTEEPLYLGRSRRIASAGQRIVLHAQDRGCTFPGCTVPSYGCQVHHAEMDWVDGGQTNITDECLACGPHNRLVKPGGWRTRKRKDGRTEWIPPPHLDTGQSRVNDYHHPENYLLPDDDAA
jgi:hypothetical protein